MIALVITIVILIILATVSINAIFGENGLIQSAEKGRLEHEKGMTREQIELVLADAFVEKNTNSKYNEHEFLDKFIEDRLEGVNIEEEEIELNGFVFELDRSVPRLGRYLGEATGPRIKEIKVTDKTTNSVSVEVDARNAEGGEYTYLYKKDSEGEEAWKEADKGKENTYTFNNLEANKIYNIKVKVTTKEGEAEGTINVLTGEIPEGAITFGTPTWSNGQARVTVNTTSGMQIEYQINALTEESWKTIANGGTISGIQHGQTVYARLTDGTNHGEYASIGIKDTVVPTVSSIVTGEITQNSIAVTVNAADNESGLATSNTYKYYLNGAEKTISANNSYTFTGLTENTEYTIKVEVYDKAGNKGENTINVNTIKDPNSIESRLKEGDYVNYVDGTGRTKQCVVLYGAENENYSSYGIQIITMNTVEDITLGGSDFDKFMNSYNNAISTLNSEAMKYNNNIYSSDARSVGSVPDNKDSQAGMFSSSYEYMSSYNGKLRDIDTNYETDYNQMKALNIHDIDVYYWLASRSVNSSSRDSSFYVRYVDPYSNLGNFKLCIAYSNGLIDTGNLSYGLRPVFTLKSGIKVTGGNGTESSPYELGV